MPTMKDVARRAGVSTATVSRVLNRDGVRVSPEKRTLVMDAVRELGYRPNHLPRNLRRSTSATVGLVISDIENPFFPAVARGCEDAALEHGLSVVLSNTDEDPARERASLHRLGAERVAGVLLASTGTVDDEVQGLVDAGIPVVALDRIIIGAEVDSVTVDNEAGAYAAVTHLIELGHETIAMVGGPERVQPIREREAGFLRALKDHGLPIANTVVRGDLRPQGGRWATEELMSRSPRPTAIFAVNNQTTVGVLHSLADLGLAIPDQVSVLGFDEFDTADLLGISVLAQPAYQLGARAVELLLRRLKEPEAPVSRHMLETSLRLRGSTGPPS